MSRWWQAVSVDLTPLRRYRDFRLLTAAATISMFGSMITMVARRCSSNS